jgi:hypothetical protein
MSTTTATLAVASLVASLSLSGVALAAPTHLTDGQYLAAARCEGLMSSSALGKEDVSSIEAVLKSQSAGPDLADRAEDARMTAERQAGHAGPQAKAALVAERDGVCQSYAGGASMTAISKPATTN